MEQKKQKLDFPINPVFLIKVNTACLVATQTSFHLSSNSGFFYVLSLPLYAFLFFNLQSIKRKDDPQEVKVQMQFMVYGTRPSKDKSGAYLFLPDGKAKVFTQLLYLRCLPASQKALIEPPLCIVLLYHAGELRAGRQAVWGLLHLFLYTQECSGLFDLPDLVTHSVGDSFHLSLHCSASPIFSTYSAHDSISLLLLPALQPERATCGARRRGTSLLRGGGTLPAFSAVHSYPQCAR